MSPIKSSKEVALKAALPTQVGEIILGERSRAIRTGMELFFFKNSVSVQLKNTTTHPHGWATVRDPMGPPNSQVKPNRVSHKIVMAVWCARNAWF